jgi:AraC family transcriptional regulator of arabinose operon
MRQALFTDHDPGGNVSIATLAKEYPRHSNVPLHAHGSDQLIYASRGIMEVSSGPNIWVIPPHFGLWIPAKLAHRIRMPERVSMRTLYLRPGLVDLGMSCVVLHVRPFLRELIFEIIRTGRLRLRNRVECAFRDLLVAQLKQATAVPTGVELPSDERALRVAQAVIADPAGSRSIAALCGYAGLSVRTLQRSFRREVGMDFESWRRQVRLMKALELLVAGRSVKEVAYAVGYQQTGSFVTLFRLTLGATPKAWIAALERL